MTMLLYSIDLNSYTESSKYCEAIKSPCLNADIQFTTHRMASVLTVRKISSQANISIININNYYQSIASTFWDILIIQIQY